MMDKSKEANKLYWTYKEYDECTREPDDDGWDNGDWYRDYELVGVGTASPEVSTPYWDSIAVKFSPVIGERCYVVLARYTTGSTFGYMSGNGKVKGIYQTPAEALALKVSIQDNTFNGYKEWEGYFESLDDVELHSFVIGVYNGSRIIYH